MANINAESVTTSGVVLTAHPAGATGDRVRPNVFVRVVNGSGASVDVTLVTHRTFDGLPIADRVWAVDAGDSLWFRTTRDYVAADGWCDLTYSDETSVTLEVFN